MKFLTADNLIDKRIVHGFFTRQGGVSEGIFASLNCGPGSGDLRDAVVENRGRALAALTNKAENARLVTLYQIHSNTAVCADVAWQMGEAPRADAVVAGVAGIALGILTADCVPVLFADKQAHVIGAAHAGWRGALSGIVESAIAAMERLGARRERIAAAIGPCISQKNYEVDKEFRAQFLAAESANAGYFIAGERPAHWQFDLAAYVAQRLARSGVGNISALGACTYEREAEFFSFRRATHRGESDYGRQLSAIALLA